MEHVVHFSVSHTPSVVGRYVTSRCVAESPRESSVVRLTISAPENDTRMQAKAGKNRVKCVGFMKKPESNRKQEKDSERFNLYHPFLYRYQSAHQHCFCLVPRYPGLILNQQHIPK